MLTTDFLVIGAGPTGLGAALQLHQLGADYRLVEAADGPGGMAASVIDDHGFVWDLGGHVLHSHFAEFDKAIASSGVEMLHPTRNGWVWIGGRLVPTPIQHQVYAIPADLRPDAPVADLADYYRNHFGTKLLDEFFRPFTEKMWATPLELIDDSWTSLRNGSNERNVPSIKIRQPAEPHSTVTFPYPAGGTGRLWSALAATLDQDRIAYNARVMSVDLHQRIAELSDGTAVRFNECVSSMPLTTLLGTIGNPALAAQARQLRSSNTFVVGLGYDGTPPPALADKSWLYCPDSQVAWHRATVLSNYDPANAGAGRWSILCEVGRSELRAVADADALHSCLATMADLGADPDRLVSTWTRTVAMGYPVPTLGRDDVLTQIDDTLTAQHVRTRGRFGGWRYESCNQDYSFMQGVQAVDAALHGTAEDVYWHPERFS